MLQVPSGDTRSMSPYSVEVTVQPLDWREKAVTACQIFELQHTDKLQQDLASRVMVLTGQAIDSRSIYLDRKAQTAITVVEGTMFRLRRGDLFLVRPCVYCGVRSFESSPIHDLADLGHALSLWQPRCAGCDLEDEDWSHSF